MKDTNEDYTLFYLEYWYRLYVQSTGSTKLVVHLIFVTHTYEYISSLKL